MDGLAVNRIFSSRFKEIRKGKIRIRRSSEHAAKKAAIYKAPYGLEARKVILSTLDHSQGFRIEAP